MRAEQFRRYGPVDTRECFGRRNCNVNLDDLWWDRPDLGYEPQQARVVPRSVQVDETKKKREEDVLSGEGCTVRVKVAPEVALFM